MARWHVIAKVFIDFDTQYISNKTVPHPTVEYEGRVLDWGHIDRGLPTPPSMPQVGDCRIRIADTDRRWRNLLAYQTPRRRLLEIKILQPGESESGTEALFTGEIVWAEFGPGYIEVTAKDITFAWIDEDLPVHINRANYPELPAGIDSAFMPRVYGDCLSTDSNPQGQILLPHIAFASNGDRWCVSKYRMWDVPTIYRKLPTDGLFSVVPASEYTINVENEIFNEVPTRIYPVTYVDFNAEQPEGTEIRADVRGVYERDAFGVLPAYTSTDGPFRNPVDILIHWFQNEFTKTNVSQFETEDFNLVRIRFGENNSEFGPYYCDGVIHKQMNGRELLGRFLTSFQTDMPVRRNGRIGLAYVEETDDNRPVLTEAHILRDQFFETIANPTVNRVHSLSSYNYALEQWADRDTYNNDADQAALAVPSINSVGDLEADSSGAVFDDRIEEDELQLWWVRDATTKLQITERFLSWVALGSYRQKFKLPYPEVRDVIELARNVGLTHWAGLDTGGYTNKEAVIRRTIIDLNRLSVDVESILRVPQTLTVPELPLMDFDHYYEMVSRPQQSQSGTAKVFHSAKTRFNPDWFDGTTLQFFMEIETSNAHASNAYDVDIIDFDTSTLVARISVPANSAQTVRSTEFTPLSGEKTYTLRLAQTASNNELKVVHLRIKIVQRGATKTRLQFTMLGGGAINNDDLVYGDDRFTGGDTGYIEESNSRVFLKEAEAWGTPDHWTWEVVGSQTGSLGTNVSYWSLNKFGTGEQITEIQYDEGEDTIQSVDFSHSAANFGEDGNVVMYSRCTTTFFNNTVLYKASLYVTILDLRKANIDYWVEDSRILLTAANFNALVSAHHDATLTNGGTGTAVLRTADTPEEAASETTVPGSTLDPSGAKARYRVQLPSLIEGAKYYDSGTTAGGLTRHHGGHLILKADLG